MASSQSGGSTAAAGTVGAAAGTGGIAGTDSGAGGVISGNGGTGGVIGPNAGAGGVSGSSGSAGSVAMGTGQYTATLNATTPYALGSEHIGHTVFGTVIDTTQGANRARVGWIQQTAVTAGQQVKWVWPHILVSGHTYELAMFGDDYSNNRTCMVGSGTPNPGWILKIPAASGDFEFLWKRPVPRMDGPECIDFPVGPIP